MKSNKQSWLFFSLIILASLVMHWPIMNKDLIGVHLWRQTETQWNILNFCRHDFNILNPRSNFFNGGRDNIVRLEFPIMQWVIALFYKILGEHIIIMRSIIFIIGTFSILGMYRILSLLFNNKWGSLFGAWMFCFSPVFYFYTINPMPDNLALCSSIWFLYYFLRYYKTDKTGDLLVSAIFLLLASLAKLPFIILSTGVGIYLLQKRQWKFTFKTVGIYALLLLPALAWYAWVIPSWGENSVVNGILGNQLSREKFQYIIYYHLTTMFPHILMNAVSTVFFLIGIYFVIKNKCFLHPLFWVLLASLMACVGYFFFEINIIDTVHDYYMMPFLPFLYIVAGYGAVQLFKQKRVFQLAAGIVMLWTPVTTYATTQSFWSLEKTYFNRNLFIYQNDLKHAIPDGKQAIILNDVSGYMFSYKIDKMGHVFYDDYLPADWVKDMIERFKIEYMYSDSRKVDENPEVKQYLESLIMQRGDIRVFKLKKPNSPVSYSAIK